MPRIPPRGSGRAGVGMASDFRCSFRVAMLLPLVLLGQQATGGGGVSGRGVDDRAGSSELPPRSTSGRHHQRRGGGSDNSSAATTTMTMTTMTMTTTSACAAAMSACEASTVGCAQCIDSLQKIEFYDAVATLAFARLDCGGISPAELWPVLDSCPNITRDQGPPACLAAVYAVSVGSRDSAGVVIRQDKII